MAYYILKSYKLKFDPFRIFTALKERENFFALESSFSPCASLGRYSYFGSDPFFIFSAHNRNPFQQLSGLLNNYQIPQDRSGIPFLGGAVGYLSYDLGFYLEPKIKQKNSDDLKIPGCYFAFYNTVVIVDHLKKTLSIFSCGFPEKKEHLAKALCARNFKTIEKLLSQIDYRQRSTDIFGFAPDSPGFKSNFTKDQYLAAIKKAKDYIRAGDIYQVNLSQRFESSTNLSAAQIYRRLRQISPSAFAAYFHTRDFQVLSASPERFLSVRNNAVSTRPMKGTRRRGRNNKEDMILKQQLLSSAKDKAELMMIVDLERNDLGKVCNYDSVRVAALRELEKYNTVYQTTATVEGRLYNSKDRFDLLRACFPGGSITGCPKIRAMEIIDELEPTPRSLYTGCLGYLSFSGAMDFNILIRTILKKGRKIYFSAGGGIVADSVPQDEYEETLIKAQAMIKALS